MTAAVEPVLPVQLPTPGQDRPRGRGAAGRSRHRIALGTLVPAVVVLGYVLVAVIGPLLVPYSPVGSDLQGRLLPPGGLYPDGSTAYLGSDALGRDMLAQIIHGARTSLLVGVLVVAISGVVGLAVGLAIGYLGGWPDVIASRVIDVLLAFPAIVLAIVIAGTFDRSLWTVVAALTVVNWIGFARLARSMTSSLREREWVRAARVIGVPAPSIVVRHVLPFVVGPALALATTEFAGAILAEAGLSFLGLGLPPATASWGQSIASGKDYLASAWWISAFPGMALALLVVSVGIVGDHLTRRFTRRS